MLPLAVVNSTALATRISAIARSAAPTIGAAIARIRATGVQLGTKADDLIAYAKANPVNAALVALTLGSLGANVTDLFTNDDGKVLAQKVTLGVIGMADAQKILGAGASSEKLNLSIAENASDVYTAREVLRFARAHYGSNSAAIRAHKMHQAFFEMPLNDVEVGFDTIRL